VRLAFVEAGLAAVAQATGDAPAAASAEARALARLSEAAALRQWELAFVRTEPWFDPLRGNPGFAALVAQVGFPP
jgi:hypothetical protein